MVEKRAFNGYFCIVIAFVKAQLPAFTPNKGLLAVLMEIAALFSVK